jgi:hypothetical protein
VGQTFQPSRLLTITIFPIVAILGQDRDIGSLTGGGSTV